MPKDILDRSKYLAIVLFLLTSSCGYHLGVGEKEMVVSLPYVEGDKTTFFTSQLIKEINESPSLSYSNRDGGYFLKVAILDSHETQVGWRIEYIQDNKQLKQRIRPTEGRRTVRVKASLFDASTGAEVWGPHIFSASADYDYINEDALQDLEFYENQIKKETTVLQFSLGQVEPLENAQEASLTPIYRRMAKYIINSLSMNL